VNFTRNVENSEISSDLVWLIGLLWGSDASVDIIPANADDRRGGERYAIVGGIGHPRFLVPMASERAAISSLRAYNALRSPARRAMRSGLAAGMRWGVDPVMVRHHLLVDAGPDSASALLDEVAPILGGGDVAFAVGVGAPGPNRKPTLQVFSDTGAPIAYAKVGWNDYTRGLVRREAEALRTVSGGTANVGAPRLMDVKSSTDLEMSLVAPLPEGVRRHPPASPTPLGATLDVAGMGERTTSELAASDYVAGLAGRLSDLTESPSEKVAAQAIEVIATRAGHLPLSVGGWHGDWTHWNLARDGERLFAIDWEHWGRAPLGFDLLHYAFAATFFARRRSPDEGTSAMRRLGLPRLVDLGVPRELAPWLVPLYLLELLARALDARRSGAGVNTRLLPALLGSIDDAVEDLG